MNFTALLTLFNQARERLVVKFLKFSLEFLDAEFVVSKAHEALEKQKKKRKLMKPSPSRLDLVEM